MDYLELLFLGVVLFLLFYFGALLFLLVSHFKLKHTVSKLEEQIKGLQAGRVSPSVVAETIVAQDTVVAKNTAAAPDMRVPEKKADKRRVVRKYAPIVASEPTPPKAFVFTPEKTAALMEWIKENWFYAIAALSLALSGVFFVQYGIENGYLTPFWRVMSSLGLGACLIGAGEWIRRKSGDEADSHTANLPSVFSGAGLIALFAGVLAARQMYGLIGAEMALVGLVSVSALAVALGWFYGPLLAMVGIIGATAAPFLVGGSSDSGWLFYYYFALILVAGMLVDAIKRWAWVSVLALISTFVAAFLMFFMGAGGVHFLSFALIAAVAAAAIPSLRFWPQHSGQMVSASLARFKGRKPSWPEFPTRLATGAFAAAVIAAVFVSFDALDATEVWLVFLSLAVLMGMAVIWFKGAPALRDNGCVAAAGFLVRAVCPVRVYWRFIFGVQGRSAPLARGVAALGCEPVGGVGVGGIVVDVLARI